MRRLLAFAVAASFLAPAYAEVTVKDAWVRATAPQQQASAAYMRITSTRPARLVEVRSPAAGVVEVHASLMEKGMSRMRPAGPLELPAGKTVELEPGGYHVMMMDLKAPMQEGQSVPLTLVVEDKDGKRERIEVKATVRALTALGHGHGGH